MLENSLTYALASISDEGIGAADQLIQQRFGWNVRELRVLRLVRGSPGIGFTELARLTRFERSATSRILNRMLQAGLISRTGVSQDARRFTLAVTLEGERLCRKADPLTQELEALMLKPLDAKRRAEFLAALKTVMAWVTGGYAERLHERFAELVQDGENHDRR